jgi:hypothetical protein
MIVRNLAVALLVVAGGLAAGCGGNGPAAEPPAATDGQIASPGYEDAWLDLLAELGVEPDQSRVDIEGSREGSELVVTITVPDTAANALTFGDGLYGAQAWGASHGVWTRVDTADIRTEIAPLLEPGQTAHVTLPLRDFEGGCCRVLVPVEGFAAWADIS